MASSWYEDFDRRLAAYKNGGSPISPVVPYGADLNTAGFGMDHAPEGLGERFVNAGSAVLDILSRPGYATGSFLNDILRDSQGIQNDVDPLEAAWEGFTGKRKEFFSPYEILDPHQEGESGAETAGRFVTDFLASVLTDPLTLIPGSAAVKAARGVGELTGATKALEKARSLTRPELAVEHVKPENVPVPDLPDWWADEVATKVNPAVNDEWATPLAPQRDITNSAVGASPLAPVEVPTVASDLKIQPYMPDDKAQALIQHLLTGGKVNATGGADLAGRLFAAKSVRAGINEAMAGIKGRLFRDGEFTNPWQDIQAVKEVRPEPIKPTFEDIAKPEPTFISPGANAREKLQQNVIVRSIVDAAKEEGPEAEMLALSRLPGNERTIFYATDTDKVVKGGRAVSPYKIAEKYSAKSLADFTKANPAARVRMYNEMEGKEYFTAPGMYAKMLEGNFPLADLENMSIAKMGERVPAEEYFQSRRQKWTKGEEIPPSAEEMAAYEAEMARRADELKKYETDYNSWKDEQLGIPSTVRQKPDKEARVSWLASNADKLTEADIKSLRNSMNSGNEKGFLNKIDEIMQREGTLDIDAIDALEEAVKAGRVSPEDAKAFFENMGVKNFRTAKNRIAAIDAQIARLEGQGASLRGTQPRQNAGFAGATPLPAPTIKPLEVTKFKLGTPLGREQVKTVIKDSSSIDPNTLSPEILDLVGKSLKGAMETEFRKARKEMTYGRKSGAKSDAAELFAGKARYLQEYNVYSQLTHFGELMRAARKGIPTSEKTGKSIAGYQRGKYLYDRVLPALKASDDTLRTYGIQPSAFPGGKGLPLSFFDILSALPEKWVVQHVFSMDRQVSLTQLFRAAEAVIKKEDDLFDVTNKDMMNTILGSGRDFDLPGTTDRMSRSAAGFADEKAAAAGQRIINQWEKKNPGQPVPADIREKAGRVTHGAGKRVWDETTEPLGSPEFQQAILDAISRNRASAGLQAEEFVKNADYAAITKFIDDVSAANTQSEVFSMVKNARQGVRGFVKDTADIVPPPGAVDAIADDVAMATSNFGTEMAMKAQKGFDNAETSSQRAAVGVKIEDAIDDFTGKMVDDGTIPMVNLGDASVYRRIRQWDMGPLAKAIAAYFPHLGEGPLRQVWLASQNSSNFIANHFARQLTKFQRQVGTTADAKRVFDNVRLGSQGVPTDAPHEQFMQKILDTLFDTSNGEMGFLQRNGIQPQHVNSHLKHFGIDAKQYGLKGDNPYQSWRDWEGISDPLDFLSKYFQAASRAHSEQQLGASLSQRFGFDSNVTGDMVKIRLTKGSRIAHLIDRDMWYPKEVAENMKALDKTLFDAAQPPRNNQIGRIFDNLTHKYKTGLTIYRPGHHLRNMYGDIWLNYMDGVRSPKYYNQAQRVLASRKNHYDDLVLETRVGDLNPKHTAITMRTRDGREVPLSYDDIYKLSVSQGILHDYATIEDLGFANAARDIDKVEAGRSLTRPFDGKLHEKMTGLGEYRDHYVRMAHLMSLLERDKNGLRLLKPLHGEHPEATLRRSLELQFQDYSARIRKWHPDGSDLTLWEKRVMRRGVLFYSWIRKAMPLVIESMLTRPGRFLTFPKAMYEAAEANGIDLNGLGDPFPVDQLFPVWMGAIQGPQFGSAGQGYMGVRPGVPGVDILDNYFSSPGAGFRELMSGVHPLFKVPFELNAGETAQGIPIKDLSAYALGQIPFGNLANTTVGWMNGGDKPIGSTAPSNEVYDQTSSGVRDPAAIAWINFLSGLGLMDMSKPSYQKAAEFDTKYGRMAG